MIWRRTCEKKWFRPDFGTTESVSLSWFEWCHSQLWYRQPQDPIQEYSIWSCDVTSLVLLWSKVAWNSSKNFPFLGTLILPRAYANFFRSATWFLKGKSENWVYQLCLIGNFWKVKISNLLGMWKVWWQKSGQFCSMLWNFSRSFWSFWNPWIGSWGCRYQSWEWHHSNQDNETDTVVPKSGLNHFFSQVRRHITYVLYVWLIYILEIRNQK